ncbi:MAG: hypothetical protein J0H84_17410 [Rhizobiales bacterium]|jgi:hypothetical protein|nr:hypothetical protein [Hyphomicrobiales bacterium]
MTHLTSHDKSRQNAAYSSRHPIFQQPDEVLIDPRMSRDEKRALLASWASDAHAVPGLPSMRQLEDGSLIEVDEIFHALKALDAGHGALSFDKPPTRLGRKSSNRRSRPTFRDWTRILRRGRRDDDDDPPPCPAFAAIPPKAGGGGAFVHPDPALV